MLWSSLHSLFYVNQWPPPKEKAKWRTESLIGKLGFHRASVFSLYNFSLIMVSLETRFLFYDLCQSLLFLLPRQPHSCSWVQLRSMWIYIPEGIASWSPSFECHTHTANSSLASIRCLMGMATQLSTLQTEFLRPFPESAFLVVLVCLGFYNK